MDRADEIARGIAANADEFIEAGGLADVIAASIRLHADEKLQTVIDVLEPMAAARVGNERPGGGRDSFLYEQGIGMEASIAAVRSLKSSDTEAKR